MPTAAEELVAQHIDGLVGALLDGQLMGIGVCAVRNDGSPAFFYLNKPERPVLRSALNRLMGLYESSQLFKEATNAPQANRSYRSH